VPKGKKKRLIDRHILIKHDIYDFSNCHAPIVTKSLKGRWKDIQSHDSIILFNYKEQQLFYNWETGHKRELANIHFDIVLNNSVAMYIKDCFLYAYDISFYPGCVISEIGDVEYGNIQDVVVERGMVILFCRTHILIVQSLDDLFVYTHTLALPKYEETHVLLSIPDCYLYENKLVVSYTKSMLIYNIETESLITKIDEKIQGTVTRRNEKQNLFLLDNAVISFPCLYPYSSRCILVDMSTCNYFMYENVAPMGIYFSVIGCGADLLMWSQDIHNTCGYRLEFRDEMIMASKNRMNLAQRLLDHCYSDILLICK
jgi:hypothetical protein